MSIVRFFRFAGKTGLYFADGKLMFIGLLAAKPLALPLGELSKIEAIFD